MKFITPKNKNSAKVDWLISERVRAAVNNYAEYTEYTESEVVDRLLINILEDKGFLEWIKNKRNNKRIIKQLEIESLMKENKIG